MFDLGLKILSWLFSLERSKKRLIQIIFDCWISSISLLAAFFMRLETADFIYRFDTYIGVLIALTTALSVFFALGQYNNVARHISIEAAYNIAIGSAISCTVLLCSIFLFELTIPRSVPLIYAMFLCLSASSARFFVRAIGHNMNKQKPQNVAICGTGAESVQLLDALRKNENYRVRFLIDDSPKMQGKNLGGVEVCGPEQIAEKFKKLGIKILLIAAPRDIQFLRKRILAVLSDYPFQIKTIPSISSLIAGETKISDMQDIKIEDLLGRKPAVPKPELMEKTIFGKTIFVTGAGGSIGSEICRQIIPWKPRKLILLDVSEYAIYKLLREFNQLSPDIGVELIPLIGSVQDKAFVEKVFDRFVIDTTYHAAAYKHVPLMEMNVMQCFANNVVGTQNVVESAIAANVKNFVLVSTDKAVNPTNFMGASKRFAELICQSLPTEKVETCFSIVRFGNVLGSSGSVVPLFKKQIESGGPVTLTHPDITRYFMTIAEASQLVIQAGAIGKGSEVFVLDMGEPIKILELAKRMVALSGLKPILNGRDGLKDDEIAITVTGLRPGEKLFEELAYNPNLAGTDHPKIQTTAEPPIKRDELKALLTSIDDAIRSNDFQKLYNTISSVAKGIVGLEGSSDVFIKRHDAGDFNIVTFPNHNKH